MVEKTGRGRAPCCDKTKVKRGPWSPDEDLRLTSFIQTHGHSNWRALPKQAGLLRCGKSCRLRWVNYLTPHVKRGNFTPQEEQTVINLHNSIGNKWSKIASYLPGRTDNEIKNVWNTHLKKRLKNDAPSSSSASSSKDHVSSSKEQEVQGTNSPASSYESNLTNSTDTRLVEETYVDEEIEIKIPLESDTDFWSLFDSLEECSDNIGVSNLNSEEKVNEGNECSNWFRLLENELGLTSDVENDVPMSLEPEIGPELDYFPIWPSSPQNLGI